MPGDSGLDHLCAERPAPAAMPYTANRLVEGLTGGHATNGEQPNANEELCEEKLMSMCESLPPPTGALPHPLPPTHPGAPSPAPPPPPPPAA